jgi:excisionase family DNA binding protein
VVAVAKAEVASVGIVTVAPVSMSVDKAVEYTGVGRSTLYDMIKHNELPVVRIRELIFMQR